MKEFTFFAIGAISMFIITEFGYGWATAFIVVSQTVALFGFAASNKASTGLAGTAAHDGNGSKPANQ